MALNIIMDSNDIVKNQLNKLEQILVPLSCIFVFLKNNVKISIQVFGGWVVIFGTARRHCAESPVCL